MCTPPPRSKPLPPLQAFIDAEWKKLKQHERPLYGEPVWSIADQKLLAEIEARQAEFRAKYHRRQALKPAALLSRLKARLARVSWDSWG